MPEVLLPVPAGVEAAPMILPLQSGVPVLMFHQISLRVGLEALILLAQVAALEVTQQVRAALVVQEPTVAAVAAVA